MKNPTKLFLIIAGTIISSIVGLLSSYAFQDSTVASACTWGCELSKPLEYYGTTNITKDTLEGNIVHITGELVDHGGFSYICFGTTCSKPRSSILGYGVTETAVVLDSSTVAIRNFGKKMPTGGGWYYKCTSSGNCGGAYATIKCTTSDPACKDISDTVQPSEDTSKYTIISYGQIFQCPLTRILDPNKYNEVRAYCGAGTNVPQSILINGSKATITGIGYTYTCEQAVCSILTPASVMPKVDTFGGYVTEGGTTEMSPWCTLNPPARCTTVAPDRSKETITVSGNTTLVKGAGYSYTCRAGSCTAPVPDSIIQNSSSNPILTSFTASPTTITAGQSSTLIWTSTNADKCTLGGLDKASSASMTITPTSTTTYTIVCSKGSISSVSKSVLIIVNTTNNNTSSSELSDIAKIKLNTWITKNITVRSTTLTQTNYVKFIETVISKLNVIKSNTPTSNKTKLNTINYLVIELGKILSNIDDNSFLDNLFN